MIDASFVSSIADLQKSAMQVGLHYDPKFGDEMLVRLPTGETVWKKLPPARAAHVFESVDDFAAYLEAFPLAEVFVGSVEAKACLDRSTRREDVSLRLPRSPAWAYLLERAKLGAYMQIPDALSWLRFSLGSEGLGTVDDFVSAARAIQFSNENTTRANLQPNRESMGRAVERSVKSETGAVPTSVVVRVPVFAVEGLAISRDVLLGVAFNIEQNTVSFPPIGNAIVDAEISALAGVRDILKGRLKGLPVSRGSLSTAGGWKA